MTVQQRRQQNLMESCLSLCWSIYTSTSSKCCLSTIDRKLLQGQCTAGNIHALTFSGDSEVVLEALWVYVWEGYLKSKSHLPCLNCLVECFYYFISVFIGFGEIALNKGSIKRSTYLISAFYIQNAANEVLPIASQMVKYYLI